MTNQSLWRDYFERARIRREMIRVLEQHAAHADILREAQELVELLLKGLLRRGGVDPPKWHDVGIVLQENAGRLPESISGPLTRIMALSSRLRRDRELAFCGAEDFLPTAQYTAADSAPVLEQVDWLLQVVSALPEDP